MPVRPELFSEPKGAASMNLFALSQPIPSRGLGLIRTIVAPTRSPSLFHLLLFLIFTGPSPPSPPPFRAEAETCGSGVNSIILPCLLLTRDACQSHYSKRARCAPHSMQRAAGKLAIKSMRFS